MILLLTSGSLHSISQVLFKSFKTVIWSYCIVLLLLFVLFGIKYKREKNNQTWVIILRLCCWLVIPCIQYLQFYSSCLTLLFDITAMFFWSSNIRDKNNQIISNNSFILLWTCDFMHLISQVVLKQFQFVI